MVGSDAVGRLFRREEREKYEEKIKNVVDYT